jgi:hypothetical protein
MDSEFFLIPLGLLICKAFAGNVMLPSRALLFLIFVFFYTIAIMAYRCKILADDIPKSTKPDDKEKPPINYENYNFKYAMFPIIIWILIALATPYTVKFNLPQFTPIFLFIVGYLGLYITGFVFYNSALRLLVIPQCYSSSIIGGIFGFLKSIFSFLF